MSHTTENPPGFAIKRLINESNIWVATVRPDNRPHLTPVWFVWEAGKIFFCIQSKSVKAQNIAKNPQVALSLEDGSNVVICEGKAAVILETWPKAVHAAFLEKYNWDIQKDSDYDRLIEVTPSKWLVW